MGAMQPIFDKFLSRSLQSCSLALRNFIFVMREHQIFAAEVKIKTRSEQLHAHGTAFDMPAGPALPPWTGPKHRAVLLHARFPKRKISHRFLGVFIITNTFAYPHFLK